jgi:hypothetical protein
MLTIEKIQTPTNEDSSSIASIKKTRRIVIKNIMQECLDDKMDVNDALRKIKAFDKEAIDAFEKVMHYQTMCLHYSEEGNVMKEPIL